MRVAPNAVSPRSLVTVLALLAAGCTASASMGPGPAAVAPVAASAAPAAVVPATPPPPPPPTTAEGCKACNGIWALHGLAQSESCNCRTTDGGKRCRDGAECQGLCVVAGEQPEREVVEAGPPARGYFVGTCSATVAIFGCYRAIEKGAASKGPAPLSEPPPTLCAD